MHRENVLICILLGTRKEDVWRRLRHALDVTQAIRLHLLFDPADPTDPDEATYAEVQRKVETELGYAENEWSLFTWEKHPTNPFNLQVVLESLVEVLAAEKDNAVTIATTGGAPAGIALTAASILFGGKYRIGGMYVPAREYGEELQYVPNWMLGAPPLDDITVHVLAELAKEEDGLDKGALVTRLEASGLIPKSLGKSAYRRVKSRFLDVLESKGFIVVQPDPWDRRKHVVQVTQAGMQALRVLEPMTRDPSEYLFVRGSQRRNRQNSLERYGDVDEQDDPSSSAPDSPS